MRIGVIHNPSNPSVSFSKTVITKTFEVAMKYLPLTLAKSFVTKLVKEEFAVPFINGKITLDDLAVHVCKL